MTTGMVRVEVWHDGKSARRVAAESGFGEVNNLQY